MARGKCRTSGASRAGDRGTAMAHGHPVCGNLADMRIETLPSQPPHAEPMIGIDVRRVRLR